MTGMNRRLGGLKAISFLPAAMRAIVQVACAEHLRLKMLGYGFERATAQIERIDFGDARGGPRHEPRGNFDWTSRPGCHT